jgi:hypothetical protein
VGPARVTGAVPVGAGRGREGGAWKRCEREKREKEMVGLGTIPAYVHRADTSADKHKRADLRDDYDDLCSSATR